MNVRRTFLIAATLLTSFYACEDNKEEDIPEPGNETKIENVSFASDVAPILTSNCVSCHSNSGASAGYNFEGYTNVKKHVADAALLGAINHESNYSPMPKGGAKLSATKIETISVWITEGAKDN